MLIKLAETAQPGIYSVIAAGSVKPSPIATPFNVKFVFEVFILVILLPSAGAYLPAQLYPNIQKGALLN